MTLHKSDWLRIVSALLPAIAIIGQQFGLDLGTVLGGVLSGIGGVGVGALAFAEPVGKKRY